MKRTAIHLDEIARLDHLAWAFWRAAQGKRHRPEVQAFEASLEENLGTLRAEILAEAVVVGGFHRFEIFDPKRREIHAPHFRERVLHHALMAHLEPVIDRYLVDDTYACRPNKGHGAAIRRAQEHCRRWPWYLKFDIRSYFASIDHQILKLQLRRRFKGQAALRLVDRIIDSHATAPGRGLPIGSLTSQHFANLYLSPLDRFLLERVRVAGLVRYMDDTVIWHRSREFLREAVDAVHSFVMDELALSIKHDWQLQRCSRGLPLCGFRIYPGHIGLNARRRRRYREGRAKWEGAYLQGRVDGEGLQSGYASVLAGMHGARAVAWRRQELSLRPAPDV